MSSDTTQDRILEAAGPIFAAEGFEGATVREICRRAHVNLAAVNYHFGSKEGLYVAAVRQAHPNRSEQRFTPDPPPDLAPADRLRGFVRTMLGRLLELKATDWRWRLMVREIMDPTPACRDILREHFQANFGALLSIIDELVAPDIPAHRRHQIALSIVAQCVYYRSAVNVIPMLIDEQEYATHYGIGTLTDHITQFSLAALGKISPRGIASSGSPTSCGGHKGDVHDTTTCVDA